MGPPAGRGRGVVLHGETRGVVPRMMEDVFRATSLVDVATTEVSVRNAAGGGMCVSVCACRGAHPMTLACLVCVNVQVRCSFVEIYLGRIRDLIMPNLAGRDNMKLRQATAG